MKNFPATLEILGIHSETGNVSAVLWKHTATESEAVILGQSVDYCIIAAQQRGLEIQNWVGVVRALAGLVQKVTV